LLKLISDALKGTGLAMIGIPFLFVNLVAGRGYNAGKIVGKKGYYRVLY